MKVAVTGGRNWRMLQQDRDELREALVRLGATALFHGGCRGVDTDAAAVAHSMGLEVQEFDAPWAEMGRSAGPRRNAAMVASADALIAFPGGRGTGDCVRRAQRAGLPIMFIPAGNDVRSHKETGREASRKRGKEDADGRSSSGAVMPKTKKATKPMCVACGGPNGEHDTAPVVPVDMQIEGHWFECEACHRARFTGHSLRPKDR